MTPTNTLPFTKTATITRTATPTRTVTGLATATRSSKPTSTTTGTRTAVRSRTGTPSITATPRATGTATQLPATISVDLIADRRGDNNDGTFTAVVSALVADIRGNPTGDGTVVVFSLSPLVPGVTITQNGRTNQPPDCDVSSYVADTGRR